MKLEAFSYEVEGKVRVTRAELENMILCAEGHYDVACRAAAKPGPGGFLNRMLNNMTAWAEDPPRRRDDVTDHLTKRELDLLLKILESPSAMPQLYLEVNKVYNAISAECGRVNAVAIGENRLKVDELLGVRCGVCGQEFTGPGPDGEGCAVTLIRHKIAEHVRRD